ncbi:MAG: hypothetical protein ABJA82_09710 [Myxococcales bacterium]
MTYDRIWRLCAANRGRLCRIVAFAQVRHDHLGARIYHTNAEEIAIEFDDGTRVMASRSAVVLATSRLGRLTAWKVKRGGVRKRTVRRQPDAATAD